ncbi:MAG: hypothetical protein QHJ82_15660, partial [Verrucomicrobiota bacterium]|nr:hypothetical protein [Verrucomicrobiota bacterium]
MRPRIALITEMGETESVHPSNLCHPWLKLFAVAAEANLRGEHRGAAAVAVGVGGREALGVRQLAAALLFMREQ